MYAVAGGTVFCIVFSLWAVFSRPVGDIKNSFVAYWEGRALELPFFNERFDLKMYLYVVGGTMLSLNALSGAAWHYEKFGADFNPGVFIYAGFLTFYVFDYFIFERVQLYTYDLIHEKLGMKLIWGGLIIYGWLYVVPLWGMAAYPNPGFSPAWTYIWLIGTVALFLAGLGHLPRRQHAEVHLQALAGTQGSSASSNPSTFRLASARFSTAGFGDTLATLTTWARDSCLSPLAWSSATSPIPGPGRTSWL